MPALSTPAKTGRRSPLLLALDTLEQGSSSLQTGLKPIRWHGLRRRRLVQVASSTSTTNSARKPCATMERPSTTGCSRLSTGPARLPVGHAVCGTRAGRDSALRGLLLRQRRARHLPRPRQQHEVAIDATHCHSWNSPVGRRPEAVIRDPELFGPFSYTVQNQSHRSGTRSRAHTTRATPACMSRHNLFPIPSAPPVGVAELSGVYRRLSSPAVSGSPTALGTPNHYLGRRPVMTTRS